MFVNRVHACVYLTYQTYWFLNADRLISHAVGFCVRATTQYKDSILSLLGRSSGSAMENTHKIPPIGYDAEPVMSTGVFTEKALLMFFCVLCWMGGHMVGGKSTGNSIEVW